jgi:hypothetical protein
VISGAIHDVGALISCASDVVKSLTDAVNTNTPDLNEVENLTDTLAEIGKDLEEDGDDDENKSSSTDHSSSTVTSTSSQSSSSSSRTSSSSSSGTITDTPPSWIPDPIAYIDTNALNSLATQIAMLDSLVSFFFILKSCLSLWNTSWGLFRELIWNASSRDSPWLPPDILLFTILIR